MLKFKFHIIFVLFIFLSSCSSRQNQSDFSFLYKEPDITFTSERISEVKIFKAEKIIVMDDYIIESKECNSKKLFICIISDELSILIPKFFNDRVVEGGVTVIANRDNNRNKESICIEDMFTIYITTDNRDINHTIFVTSNFAIEKIEQSYPLSNNENSIYTRTDGSLLNKFVDCPL